MHNFKEFKVWQKGRALVSEIYSLTARFPESEKFGLVSQMRRCAISICSNIAEGSGRNTEKEFLNFLKMSRGSAFELESLIILSSDLQYISENEFELVEKKNKRDTEDAIWIDQDYPKYKPKS